MYVKAMYHIKNKQFEEAINLLNQAEIKNSGDSLIKASQSQAYFYLNN